MVNTGRAPNALLRALVAESGCPYEAIARAVNTIGAEAGHALHYARPSVAQWLAGTRPRDPVPELLAEALTRRLGKPVTVSDIGMAPLSAGVGIGLALDPAAALAELGSTMRRRTLITTGAYSLAAAWGLPDWREIAERGTLTASAAGPRIGIGDVAAVRAMTRVFTQVDEMHGSGAVRDTALAYLTNEVAVDLKADAADGVRRDLHRAASTLAYLVGWYFWDSEQHPAAQKLYILALRLAASADDGPAYATVLRGMSVQARGLHHHNAAVHLAEQAVTAAGGINAQPLHRAFVTAAMATATGGARDRRAALRNLAATERALEHADQTSGPSGGFHTASLEHTAALTHRGMGDLKAAAAAMARSNRARPSHERSHRAVSSGILAETLLDLGRLEEACEAWNVLVDDQADLRCGRADTAIALMRARLRPHARVPAAASLLHRSTTTRIRDA
ncbi:hypothetical protein [Embleya sp. NPDC020630]|uniref:hypothetical protein n=1 Tax=Embleya sp. NPDC020630 TaxID=3363979 RepID=UPI0037BA874F